MTNTFTYGITKGAVIGREAQLKLNHSELATGRWLDLIPRSALESSSPRQLPGVFPLGIFSHSNQGSYTYMTCLQRLA